MKVELVPRSASFARGRSTKPICSRCGGDDLKLNVTFRWAAEAKSWCVLEDDATYRCLRCVSLVSVLWIDVYL